jgi:RHS repeat-associated protein
VLTPLWQTLATTTGASTTRYLHGSTGLARQQDTAGVWTWAVQDALGSIRSMVSSANAPLDIRQYAPYGEPTQLGGAPATVYGFTGEPTDASGLVYLRARYMRPGIAAFLSLDPVVEGNRYGYANANPVMWTDPSGRKIQITEPVKLKKKVTVQRVQRSNGLPAPSDKQGKSGGNKRIIPQMQPEVEVCDPNNRVGPCWEFANQIYQQYGISIGVENGMTSYSGISWRLDELMDK